jgi:hypothetical protein
MTNRKFWALCLTGGIFGVVAGSSLAVVNGPLRNPDSRGNEIPPYCLQSATDTCEPLTCIPVTEYTSQKWKPSGLRKCISAGHQKCDSITCVFEFWTTSGSCVGGAAFEDSTTKVTCNDPL